MTISPLIPQWADYVRGSISSGLRPMIGIQRLSEAGDPAPSG